MPERNNQSPNLSLGLFFRKNFMKNKNKNKNRKVSAIKYNGDFWFIPLKRDHEYHTQLEVERIIKRNWVPCNDLYCGPITCSVCIQKIVHCL